MTGERDPRSSARSNRKKSGQDVAGAIGPSIIQVVLLVTLVEIVIFWPSSVTYWIEKGTGTDPSKVNIEIQLPDMPPPLDLR